MFLWGKEIQWSKWLCLKYTPKGLWSHQAECALWGTSPVHYGRPRRTCGLTLLNVTTHTISKHISVHIKDGCPPTPPHPHAEELLSKSPWGWLCHEGLAGSRRAKEKTA